MKRIICIVLLIASAGTAFPQAVNPPAKRVETLNLARSLLTTKQHNDSEEDIAKQNPFARPQIVVQTSDETPQPAVAGAPVQASDKTILAGAAEFVNPSGTVQLGGVPILLFGQKKFKVGDRVSITFQDVEYQLQISAIDRTTFSLRLNNEEITRSIKSSAPASTSTKP